MTQKVSMSPDTLTKIPASVGILTLNSAKEIPRAFESIKDFDDIYICDGNSTDGTQDIARSFGARIVKQFDTDEIGRASCRERV